MQLYCKQWHRGNLSHQRLHVPKKNGHTLCQKGRKPPSKPTFLGCMPIFLWKPPCGGTACRGTAWSHITCLMWSGDMDNYRYLVCFWFINHLKLVAWIDVQRGLLSWGDRITTSKSQRPGLNMHGHYSKHEVCEKLQANQNGWRVEIMMRDKCTNECVCQQSSTKFERWGYCATKFVLFFGRSFLDAWLTICNGKGLGLRWLFLIVFET